MALIPKGIKDIDKIVKAVVTEIKLEHGSLAPELQDVIIKRRLICSTCPFMSSNATESKEYYELMNGHYTTDREDEHCTICGCPLLIRTAALTKNCGMEVWNETHNNKQELKWQKVQ